jgi:hypothetical protein
MKKILFALLFAVPAIGFAQTTTDVEVSTTILSTLELNTVTELVFGDVDAGASVSISATDGTNSNAGAGATRAEITATNASNGMFFNISGTGVSGNNITLARTTGSVGLSELTVALTFAVENLAEEVSGYTLNNSVDNFSKFFIGGSFTAPDNTSSGNVYSGTITLTATYN